MSLYVFNQYYFDLLKKVKNYARTSPDKLHVVSKSIKKAIKDHYQSYDKESDEHRVFFLQSTQSARTSWASDVTTVELAKEWLLRDEVSNVELFKGISFASLDAVMKSKKTLYYYFTLLCIFGDESMNEETTSKIITILKGIQNADEFAEALKDFSDDTPCKKQLQFLSYLQSLSATTPGVDNTMKDLESTSLGKLAKEIMEDIDVNEIHNSLGDGDIFKALSNPNGGISKLLGTVSQKMISKMASGEIKQENLLSDALKFSTQLQGMMPSGGKSQGNPMGDFDFAGMMSKVGGLANMMGGGGGGDESGDGFDMSKLANMMGSILGGGKSPGNSKGTRTTVDTSSLNRVAKAKQLRRKLEKQRQEKDRNQPTN
jgi:hypothetical protein